MLERVVDGLRMPEECVLGIVVLTFMSLASGFAHVDSLTEYQEVLWWEMRKEKYYMFWLDQ